MTDRPQLHFLGYRLLSAPVGPVSDVSTAVREICSVGGCIRGDPEGAIFHYSGLNGAQLYNSTADAMKVLPVCSTEPCELFAYRLFPVLFTQGTASRSFQWKRMFGCEAADFPAGPDHGFVALGFDVVSISRYCPATENYSGCSASFGHSPLSCNYVAAEYSVNRFCLFDELAEAIVAAERFSLEEPEPGPYVVVEVLRKLD